MGSAGHAEPRRATGRGRRVWRAALPPKAPAAPHLRLVADRGHAAVVDEGENALGVVSGDEFCGLANVVHVCAVGRARDLQGRGRLLSPGRALGLQRDLWQSGSVFRHKSWTARGRQRRSPTCSLPMATRQNLLPCPASGSSSGSETPAGAPKNASAVNAQNLPASEVKHAVLASIHLPPCLVIFP